jgi:hypothetical protein
MGWAGIQRDVGMDISDGAWGEFLTPVDGIAAGKQVPLIWCLGCRRRPVAQRTVVGLPTPTRANPTRRVDVRVSTEAATAHFY